MKAELIMHIHNTYLHNSFLLFLPGMTTTIVVIIILGIHIGLIQRLRRHYGSSLHLNKGISIGLLRLGQLPIYIPSVGSLALGA